MTTTDLLMLAITVGIAMLFVYSTWSPDWLAKRWTPARLIRESRGEMAVRWFFAAAALGAIALAIVQWMRAGEYPNVRSKSNASRMLGCSNDELFSEQ